MSLMATFQKSLGLTSFDIASFFRIHRSSVSMAIHGSREVPEASSLLFTKAVTSLVGLEPRKIETVYEESWLNERVKKLEDQQWRLQRRMQTYEAKARQQGLLLAFTENFRSAFGSELDSRQHRMLDGWASDSRRALEVSPLRDWQQEAAWIQLQIDQIQELKAALKKP